MLQAVAKAADVPRRRRAPRRHARRLRGARSRARALTGGVEALDALGLEVGRPAAPDARRLSAPDVAAALADAGRRRSPSTTKLDGIRGPGAPHGRQVRVFTRSLDEITERVPEVVEAVAALAVETLVLDGEAIALGDGGRPQPVPGHRRPHGQPADVAGCASGCR